MKQIEFVPHGVCARKILLNVDETTNTVDSCEIAGGCNGNLQGISKLIKGRPVDEVIKSLEGIKCMGGGRGVTSCPDQIAQALKTYKGN